MKSVVITGSTRGIGLGLAESFQARNCEVMISGRDPNNVEKVVRHLRTNGVHEQVEGHPCDVRDPEQLNTLWIEAVARFGKVDIWINNAGISGPQENIWRLSPAQVKDVVDTNILGLIYGSQIAVRGMLDQGQGSIYNMEGMGSDGRMHQGLIPYGMTKYAVSYFTKGLVEETKDTPLIIGTIRPGMVVTTFLTDQFKDRPEDLEKSKRIFNIIANRVDEVAPSIVDKILQNDKTGQGIAYMSRGKYFMRFVTAPFSKRDLFEG